MQGGRRGSGSGRSTPWLDTYINLLFNAQAGWRSIGDGLIWPDRLRRNKISASTNVLSCIARVAVGEPANVVGWGRFVCHHR
jgi:hypothetical protein